MKKVYESIDYLGCFDTIAYLSTLLNIEIDGEAFERLFLPQLYCYLDLSRHELRGVSQSAEAERVTSCGGAHKIMYDGESSRVKVSEFGAYFSYIDEDSFFLKGMCESESFVDSGLPNPLYSFWQVDAKDAAQLELIHGYGEFTELREAPRLVFGVDDIKDLADYINSDNSYGANISRRSDGLEKNSVSVTERASLLKMVLGLAKDVHHYDPSKTRNDAIGDIGRSLERQGLSMDRKTIKKYLDEARSMYPEGKDLK